MRLIKTENSDINYLSKIIRINNFRKHNDPEVERLKCCSVDSFNIITSIDSEPGLYVYFPTSSRINSDFLSFNNLYKNKDLNRDSSKSGMFESNGRVKAIKLRGEISEGFILPVQVLLDYAKTLSTSNLEITENTEFNAIEKDGKQFWISEKYVVTAPQRQYKEKGHTRKVHEGVDKIRIDQFRYHYDTVLLKKTPYVLNPNDVIHISSKWHGTSAISAYVLCHKPLNWKQKIAKWLTGNTFDDYDYVYSSRSVIKNRYIKEPSKFEHKPDVWEIADDVVRPHLQKGQSVYYEIVGYLPSGGYIQKDYDYGCVPPSDSYQEGVNYKIMVYRVTHTDPDGNVFEYSTQQVRQWCDKAGLTPVIQFYYGYAKDLYKDLDKENWNTEFVQRLSLDKSMYMEQMSPDCSNKVPHEGVVIKIEDGSSRAFKLKSFAFTQKEQKSLDKGEHDIEEES
jgi:hypothetical protein